MAKGKKSKAAGAETETAAPSLADKKPGVIARIVHHLQNGGGTVEELLAKLEADFPDRVVAAEQRLKSGMITTVKVQLNKKNGTVTNLGLIREKGVGEGDKLTRYSLPPAAAPATVEAVPEPAPAEGEPVAAE
jgi:hypothetical protein